jgi:hypothetical protein
VPSAINSVSSANINAQLCNTFANRLCVAHVARFDLAQSGIDASLRQSVAKSCHPLSERMSPVLFPVVDEFDHKNKCSIEATNNNFSDGRGCGMMGRTSQNNRKRGSLVMTIGDKETKLNGGLPHRQRSIAFTVFFCVLLAIAAISSCRKETPATESTGHQPASVAQMEPQNAQQTALAQMKPKRPLSKEERSCQKFVQEFYDWYVARDVQYEKSREVRTTSDYVLQLRPHVLSAELLRLLKDDSEAQSKANEIVGLDFDPFFDSQDPSPKFEVESVSVMNDRCDAVVNGIREGEKQERVMPELVAAGQSWVFVNFHYGKSKFSEDENLLSTLKFLSNDRKKSAH